MSLATAMRELGAARDHVPEEALDWCLGHWDVAAGAFQQVLARCAHDPAAASDGDMIAAYFMLHLLAEKREARAFPLLCALAKSPEGAPEILGDAAPLVLARILISLFDGNAGLLRSIIEVEGTNSMVRSYTFDALAYLTADGRIERAETESWLRDYWARNGNDNSPSPAWNGWASAVALLGCEDLMPQVREACDRDLVDITYIDMDDLENLLRCTLEDPAHMAGFEREGIRPIEDARAELMQTEKLLGGSDMDRSEFNSDDLAEEDLAEGEVIEPAVNPFRNIGRNDPCPCGSGRKFKKCCLEKDD
jgi:hypothetical protein